jgi:hypothetical protein
MIARGEFIGNGCRDLIGGHIIVPGMRLLDPTIVKLVMSQMGQNSPWSPMSAHDRFTPQSSRAELACPELGVKQT